MIENLVWATRGRSWGFRFLLSAGLVDPLPLYEKAFASSADEPTVRRLFPEGVALRFPDPLGRRDCAGRVIPHEFVALGDLASPGSAEAIWPLVAEAYAEIWDVPDPTWRIT